MKAAYTLAAVVLTLGLAGPAAAQQPTGNRDLLDVLQEIGCKVTRSEDGKNTKVHYAEYAANGRTYYLRACLSADHSRVWVSFPLTKVDRAAAAANGAALFRLLERNQETGPRHFKVDGGTLWLSGAAENRVIGTDHIRELIRLLVADLEDTRADWDRVWTRPTAAGTLGRRD
jgi:hypothetical protein